MYYHEKRKKKKRKRKEKTERKVKETRFHSAKIAIVPEKPIR